jgi:hypothetical protein
VPGGVWRSRSGTASNSGGHDDGGEKQRIPPIRRQRLEGLPQFAVADQSRGRSEAVT